MGYLRDKGSSGSLLFLYPVYKLKCMAKMSIIWNVPRNVLHSEKRLSKFREI